MSCVIEKPCSVSLLGKEKELTHNLICKAKKLSLKETMAKREEVTRKLRITRVCVSKLVVNLCLFECRNVD